MTTDGLVVLALDASDASDWRRENPELADAARIVVGRSWSALNGIEPTSLCFAPRAHKRFLVLSGAPMRLIVGLVLSWRRRPAFLVEAV